MAHRITGVDLGRSTIKLARFEGGFRRVTLERCFTLESNLPSTLTNEERIAGQLKSMRQFLTERKMISDDLAVALPGELLTFRLVDLPFSDTRRIESVLSYELEAQVLTNIDELVIDYTIVGTHGTDTRVLAAMASRSMVEAVLSASEQLAVRILGAAPLAYGAFLNEEAKKLPGTSLVLDIGCATSTICLLKEGVVEMVRTIARGGDLMTQAVARAFNLDMAAAEKAKRDLGFIGHAGMVAQTESQAHMDACLRESVSPLVRELRQTIAAYRASYNMDVERIWLTGGGARLVGLPNYLAEELHLPVDPLPANPIARGAENSEEDESPVAIGMGLINLGAAPRLNFRKGAYSYHSDYSFLRAKARQIGALAAVVIFFAFLNAFAALRMLRHEHERLLAKLKQDTVEVFGSSRVDALAISEELKGGGQGAAPPIPTETAFDVLQEISQRVPPPSHIKLDILELDIKPKKTFIKATAESAKSVDELADNLSKIECFEEVQKGKLSSVTGSASGSAAPAAGGKDGQERSEFKQFTLTINTTCP